jgi:peptide-methionine (S)-S-oxide reductase
MTNSNFSTPQPDGSTTPRSPGERNGGRFGSMLLAALLTIATCSLLIAVANGQSGGHDMKQAPAIDLTSPYSGKLERAMFAGGCFWGTQYSFQRLPGVVKSIVGYSGGNYPNPTYQDVCAHKTGHAETVYLEFDPKKLSYRQLVDYFWTIHDPTTMDRQGFDVGNQYRSAIFYTTKEQQAIAESAKKQESLKRSPIATQIVPATIFYPAEEYHQNYDIKHGGQSCAMPVPAKAK